MSGNANNKSDNTSVFDATAKIADTTSNVTNLLRDNLNKIKKGEISNVASGMKDIYNKIQSQVSSTIDGVLKNYSDKDGGESIKNNINNAINNINSTIASNVKDLENVLPSNVTSAINEMAEKNKSEFEKMKGDFNSKINSFETPVGLSTLSIYSGFLGLLNSENIVSKLTFLLLILFLFILLLRIGTSIITWAFSNSTTPILLDGMINSRQMFQIPQNPSSNGAIPVLRSVNDESGIGFTWSVWINIDDFTYKEKDYKHVFHKGNDNINLSTTPFGMNFPNNSPGLYIAPNKNDLVVIMNTFDSITEEVKIKDIPLNKWVNVIIRINEQKQMDIYINGRLTRRHILPSIPKQNYGDVYVSMNGGFSGNTSSLRYFAYPIGTNEIQSIVNTGPNTKMISTGGEMSGSAMDYLSTKWFFQTNI